MERKPLSPDFGEKSKRLQEEDTTILDMLLLLGKYPLNGYFPGLMYVFGLFLYSCAGRDPACCDAQTLPPDQRVSGERRRG